MNEINDMNLIRSNSKAQGKARECSAKSMNRDAKLDTDRRQINELGNI